MKTGLFLFFIFTAPWIMAQNAETPAPSLPRQLSFQRALELGMTRSPLLGLARAGPDLAKADKVTAGLRPNPVFLLNSESYPIFTSRPGAFFNNQELIANVTQEIETAGKRKKRLEVAALGVQVSEAEYIDARRRFVVAIAENYFQVVLGKTDLEVARQILSDFDQNLKLTEDRFRTGEISRLDLQRVEVERVKLLDDTLNAGIVLRSSKAQLTASLGYDPSELDFDVTDTLIALPLSTRIEQLRQEALASRADWTAQQSRLLQTDAVVRLEEAQRTPNVSPFFGHKRNDGVNTASFGIQIPLPVFNRNQGGIARALAEKNRQEFLALQLRNTIQAEVQQAYNSLQGNLSRVAVLEKDFLPKARQTLDTVRQIYRLGAADLITFLDAQRTYREVTRIYNKTLFETVISRYRLEAAVGKELQ